MVKIKKMKVLKVEKVPDKGSQGWQIKCTLGIGKASVLHSSEFIHTGSHGQGHITLDQQQIRWDYILY